MDFILLREQGLDALIVKPTTEPIPRNWNGEGYLRALPEDPRVVSL